MEHHSIHVGGGFGNNRVLRVAVVCWFVEGLIILSIIFGFLLFGLCIYIFGCELIVNDPMPFNNYNFCFIPHQKKPKQQKEKKVILKNKKEVNVVLRKSIKKTAKKKRKKKREKKNLVIGIGYVNSLCSSFVNSFSM